MKIRLATLLFSLGAFAAATFGQESHLIDGGEILLDDFPMMTTGYRIQIGAFKAEESAIELKQSLQEKFGLKVHLHHEENLWRVRLGDFDDSLACRDFTVSQVIPAGYSDAIMVEDNLPKATETFPPPLTESGFRIQIAALSDRENAIKRAKDIACSFPDLRAHVIWADSLYKVQIGDFRFQEDAEAWKTELEQMDSSQYLVVPAQVYGPAPPSPEQKTPDEDIFEYDD